MLAHVLFLVGQYFAFTAVAALTITAALLTEAH
jgi:hypothetical protein